MSKSKLLAKIAKQVPSCAKEQIAEVFDATFKALTDLLGSNFAIASRGKFLAILNVEEISGK